MAEESESQYPVQREWGGLAIGKHAANLRFCDSGLRAVWSAVLNCNRWLRGVEPGERVSRIWIGLRWRAWSRDDYERLGWSHHAGGQQLYQSIAQHSRGRGALGEHADIREWRREYLSVLRGCAQG